MHAPVFIFDLGKVLVDFDYTLAARKIAARSTKSPRTCTLFSAVRRCWCNTRAARSRVSSFTMPSARPLAFRATWQEFGGYFADIFTAMPGTIALHAELRQRGYQTFIFSNTNDLAIEHVRRSFPFFKDFDGYILSYEVKPLKPQPGIYEALEALTGRRGADLVYLDDRQENIEAGAQRGWRTVLHESSEKSRQTLAGWGLI